MATDKTNYRITPDILLQLNKTQTDYLDFYLYEQDNPTKEQYLNKSTIFEENEKILDNTVWNFGQYKQMVNKVYSSTRRIPEDDLLLYHMKYYNCKILLKQGFSWINVFGLVMVIKGLTSNKIYISQLFKIDDLGFGPEVRELIDNTFWTSHINFVIPRIPNFENENLSVAFELVTFNDVIASGDDVGLITNYPDSDLNFEPLISEEPLPSFIVVDAEILDNQYLRIIPNTVEPGKTVQQSLLDYFGLSGQLIPITITHNIRYGNEIDGYKSLTISNEDNTFGEIIFGIYLANITDNVNIFVSTEFDVSNKIMKREQLLLFDYNDILNPILQEILPAGNEYPVFPVNITNETVVNQQVINTEIEQKIITVSQPVFVAMETHEVIFDNKNISFTELNESCYLSIIGVTSNNIGSTTIIPSKETVDNKFYFDLSDLQKPKNKTEFKIYAWSDNKLITQGIFLTE